MSRVRVNDALARQFPVVMQNAWWEWCGSAFLCGAFFLFMWAYHDWWRGKTYTLKTANEALALAGLYGLALAYSLGPLARLARWRPDSVRWRRALGIAAAGFAAGHILVTLIPLHADYGWKYFVKNFGLLILGGLALLMLLVLTALSFRKYAARVGMDQWRAIQKWGMTVLPLIVLHYAVQGKMAKWWDWLSGLDRHPAPPGTLVGAVVVLAALLLRLLDWLAALRSEAPGGSEPPESH